MGLLASITSGLAGWLTYEDMRQKVRHHEEATLYDPILEIARANGYEVVREFPLPRRKGQLGGPREVDFVFGSAKKRAFLVLEVKFKKTAKAMAGGIGLDAAKIRDVDGDMINKVTADKKLKLPLFKVGYQLDHAVLVVWREGDIVGAIASKEPKVIQHQFHTLMRCMFAQPRGVTNRQLAEAVLTNTPIKPVCVKAGELRWGSTVTTSRYWVGALRKRPTWVNL
jgi:hypothetical protein